MSTLATTNPMTGRKVHGWCFNCCM